VNHFTLFENDIITKALYVNKKAAPRIVEIRVRRLVVYD